MAHRLALRGSHNLVAVLDGRPVGMANGVLTSDPATAELISMWVAPSARGRGVADQLAFAGDVRDAKKAIVDAIDRNSGIYITLQAVGFGLADDFASDMAATLNAFLDESRRRSPPVAPAAPSRQRRRSGRC